MNAATALAEMEQRLRELNETKAKLLATISCEGTDRDCCGPVNPIDPDDSNVLRSQCYACQCIYWRETAETLCDENERLKKEYANLERKHDILVDSNNKVMMEQAEAVERLKKELLQTKTALEYAVDGYDAVEMGDKPASE